MAKSAAPLERSLCVVLAAAAAALCVNYAAVYVSQSKERLTNLDHAERGPRHLGT
jgi:hypothetical protein